MSVRTSKLLRHLARPLPQAPGGISKTKAAITSISCCVNSSSSPEYPQIHSGSSGGALRASSPGFPLCRPLSLLPEHRPFASSRNPSTAVQTFYCSLESCCTHKSTSFFIYFLEISANFRNGRDTKNRKAYATPRERNRHAVGTTRGTTAHHTAAGTAAGQNKTGRWTLLHKTAESHGRNRFLTHAKRRCPRQTRDLPVRINSAVVMTASKSLFFPSSAFLFDVLSLVFPVFVRRFPSSSLFFPLFSLLLALLPLLLPFPTLPCFSFPSSLSPFFSLLFPFPLTSLLSPPLPPALWPALLPLSFFFSPLLSLSFPSSPLLLLPSLLHQHYSPSLSSSSSPCLPSLLSSSLQYPSTSLLLFLPLPPPPSHLLLPLHLMLPSLSSHLSLLSLF